MPSGSVLASIVSSGGVAAAKFTAAALGGSSSLFAEGVRSLVNCGNGGLLALGQRRSRKPPDELHPFGYGMELYFWSLVVAASLFVVAGGATVAKGVVKLLDPQPLSHVGLSLGVLGLSAALAGRAAWKAWREFQAGREGRPAWQAVRKAKDPTTLTVLFDNAASLLGLAVAVAGVGLAAARDEPAYDAAASIVIGLLMAAVAVGLTVQCKSLLVGESATAELKAAIRVRVEGDPAVERVEELLTMHLSPGTCS